MPAPDEQWDTSARRPVFHITLIGTVPPSPTLRKRERPDYRSAREQEIASRNISGQTEPDSYGVVHFLGRLSRTHNSPGGIIALEKHSYSTDWFALRVRTRCEQRTSQALSTQGYSVFLPSYPEKVQWSDRIKMQEVPLFPGYLFCSFDLNSRLQVINTPGVMGMVGCGNTAMPVPQEELDDIRQALDVALRVRPWTDLGRGDRVRVQRGPLSGMEGEVVRVKNGLRLLLRIDLLGRAVAVDLDPRWVQPLNPARAAYVAARDRAN